LSELKLCAHPERWFRFPKESPPLSIKSLARSIVRFVVEVLDVVDHLKSSFSELLPV